MKRLLLFSAFLVLSLSILRAQGVMISVTNPSTIARPSEVVEVKWTDIRKARLSANPQRFVLRDAATNAELVTQVADENGDGVPEAILFRSPFAPGETRQFIFAEGVAARPKAVTDARFVMPREDVAWENDRIAFRMYGPAMAKDVDNGIDVWTKRVRYPIVEKWYKEDKYHEDRGEGADFFSVGRSLGAGGSALTLGDSLVQPGVFEKVRIISTGPLRACFELTYKPVKYDGRVLTEVRKITLDAGKNLNRHDVAYVGAGNDPLTFTAGLVKRKGTTVATDPKGRWVTLWGATNDDAVNGSLGTAIMVPEKSFGTFKETTLHASIVVQGSVGETITYYSGAGWTRSGDFTTAESWNTYLAQSAQFLREPLKIVVKAH